jgi:hypothetical protein
MAISMPFFIFKIHYLVLFEAFPLLHLATQNARQTAQRLRFVGKQEKLKS